MNMTSNYTGVAQQGPQKAAVHGAMRFRFCGRGSAALAVLIAAVTLCGPPLLAIAGGDEQANDKAGGTARAEVKAPAAKVDHSIHNFGSQWMGATLQHSFVMKNEGNAPLEIRKIKPACGCTKAGDFPREIAPGESGELPFSLDSRKLRGKYEKPITVYTNDPAAPELRLRLRGECKRYVDVLPTSANFGKVTDHAPREKVLKIKNNMEKPLELTLTKTEEYPFNFELDEVTPGQEYKLKVSMAPPYAPGRFRTTATLATNVEQQKDIMIGANARIPERLEVHPPAIAIDFDKYKEKAYSRPLRFTNYGVEPVKVLEVISDDPKNVKVALEERTPGKAYTLRVDIPAGYTPPEDGREIKVKTNDPRQPLITIPVKAVTPRTAERKTRKRPVEEMVGQKAPRFAFTTTEGKSLSTANLEGQVTVLDFFAVNCGYCKKQIPRVEQVRKEYADKGVRFVAVNQTMRKEFSDQEVKDKIAELGFQGELAIDSENTLGSLFKATGFPTMVVLGKTGKVEAVNVGNVADLESKLKGQLDALLGDQPADAAEKVAAKDTQAEPEVKLVDAPADKPMAQPADPPKRRTRPAEALVGQPAPEFEMTTIDGKKLSNETLAGTVTVVDFVSKRCGHCTRQLPRVEKMRQSYADKGVRFVAVGSGGTEEEVKAKISDAGFKGDVVIDGDRSLGPLFKVRGVPSMAIIGKSGKVEAVNVGNVGDLENRMKTQLDAMLAGKTVPEIESLAAKPPQKPADEPTAKPTIRRKRPAEELIGQAAPKFELTTIDGKKISNETLTGTVTVLDFFSAKCGHCTRQLPRVEGIRKNYADKGVRFVAVGRSRGGDEEEIKDKIKTAGFQGDLAIDVNRAASSLFNVSGVPSMTIIGKTGVVEAVNVGNMRDLEDRMRTQLDAMLAGKPVPEIEKMAAKPKAQDTKPSQESVFGKPAPQFAFKTIAGEQVSNAKLTGSVAVLDFVSQGCGHCARQLPRVEKMRQKYADQGVRFITVGRGRSSEGVQAKIAESGFQGDLVFDGTGKGASLFQVRGYPTMVVLDKDGKVASVNVGNIADLESKVAGQLDALVAGKPIPSEHVGKPRPRRSRKRPAMELIGKAAPAFSAVQTLAGKEISNADFAKHPVTVLNFVAANCGFCKRQVPKVESIRDEYEQKGVRFVNVVQTMRKPYETEEVVDIFKGVGSNLELSHDSENTVGKAFKAVSFPTMVVVDRNGKIQHVNIGAKPDIDTMLKGQLDKLIATDTAGP